jgi:hypothetical protein
VTSRWLLRRFPGAVLRRFLCGDAASFHWWWRATVP